jgi:hypothetical protein
MNENEAELKEKLAKIEAKKESFKASPICYTIIELLEGIVILGCFLIFAQCFCHGCIIK